MDSPQTTTADNERPSLSATSVSDENPSRSSTLALDQTSNETGKVSEEEVAVTGVVVTPDDKPAAGARVYAMYVTDSSYIGGETVRPFADTVTADDGTFSLRYSVPKQPDQRGFVEGMGRRSRVQFIAAAENYAIGFPIAAQRRKDDPVCIQLGRPEPLSGRLIDLEGRPVDGAKIEVTAVAQAREPLDDWFIRAAQNPRPDYQYFWRADKKDGSPRPVGFPSDTGVALVRTGIIPIVETFPDGRFSIPNIGPDRLVVLELTGPTTARTSQSAFNRSKQQKLKNFRQGLTPSESTASCGTITCSCFARCSTNQRPACPRVL
jgi:hypothetical protein